MKMKKNYKKRYGNIKKLFGIKTLKLIDSSDYYIKVFKEIFVMSLNTFFLFNNNGRYIDKIK
jgi:hypothetical protein